MSKDLYVKNIPAEMGEEELRQLFALCGKVTYIHLVKDPKNGAFLGCAYVKMSSEAEARNAIVTIDGVRLHHREISVVQALPQRTAGGRPPLTTPRTSVPKEGGGRDRRTSTEPAAKRREKKARDVRKGGDAGGDKEKKPAGRGPRTKGRP